MNAKKLVPVLQLGINRGISNADYHADKTFLSSTPLKTLAKDPAQFYQDYILGKKENMSGAHLDTGTFVHSLVLEPHLVDQEFAFYSGVRKAGALYEAFREANPGKMILNVQTAAAGRAFAASIKGHPATAYYLSGGEAELSICAEINGVLVKMRADYISSERGFINDIKTTGKPAGLEVFKQTIQDFGYDLSTALYTMIAEQHYNQKFDFYWTVVSKPDIVTDVYKCSADTMARGRDQVFEALEAYKVGMSSGIWVSKTEQKSIDKSVAADAAYIIQEA